MLQAQSAQIHQQAQKRQVRGAIAFDVGWCLSFLISLYLQQSSSNGSTWQRTIAVESS
jgi:hypothetical protein